ncbi:MAG: hypothetical protein ACLR4A_03640, partial [Christensenellales bacterium]
MTADHDIGEEANAVFNALAKGETVHETRRLLVAPHCFAEQGAGDDGRRNPPRARAWEEAYIGVKINSLTDKAIIDKLIEALLRGVMVDLCRAAASARPDCGRAGGDGEHPRRQHRRGVFWNIRASISSGAGSARRGAVLAKAESSLNL